MDYSEQIRELFEMARKDAEFAAITKEYLLLEDQFDKMVGEMPMGVQDILWGYVCKGEELNYRLLELLFERIDACGGSGLSRPSGDEK